MMILKRECPLCGVPMNPGDRFRIQVYKEAVKKVETGRGTEIQKVRPNGSRSTVVCRSCGLAIAAKAGLL